MKKGEIRTSNLDWFHKTEKFLKLLPNSQYELLNSFLPQSVGLWRKSQKEKEKKQIANNLKKKENKNEGHKNFKIMFWSLQKIIFVLDPYSQNFPKFTQFSPFFTIYTLFVENW